MDGITISELGIRENCGICLSYEERVFLLVECRLQLKEVGGLRREVFELLSPVSDKALYGNGS